MSSKDRKFFEENYRRWLRLNPPPCDFKGTSFQWALLEMPCRGWLGRRLFFLGMWLARA